MEDFTPNDANAVHRAAKEAEHQANERKETMPTSANVLLRHAAELEVVRDKILDRLPDEVRYAYPKRPAVGSSASIVRVDGSVLWKKLLLKLCGHWD